MKKNLIEKILAAAALASAVAVLLAMRPISSAAYADPTASTSYHFNGASTLGTLTSGTVTLTRLGTTSIYPVTLETGGTSSFTAVVILGSSGYRPGDKVEIPVSYPAQTSGTAMLKVFNGSAAGTLLHSSTNTAMAGNALLEFANVSGTSWSFEPKGDWSLRTLGAGVQAAGQAPLNSTAGFLTGSGLANASGSSPGLAAGSLSQSGTQDYYVALRTDGLQGDGSKTNPYNANLTNLVSTWSPPQISGTTYAGFPTSITGNCATGLDYALTQIPSGTITAPVAIHLTSVGKYETSGVPSFSPWVAGISGQVPNLNAYYSHPQIKDYWTIAGVPGGGTVIQLLSGAIATGTATICTGTATLNSSNTSWLVIGPVYDTNPSASEQITELGGYGPDANHSFEMDDITIDGNIANQIPFIIGSVDITSRNFIMRRVNVINCGDSADGRECGLMGGRALATTGPSYALYDGCSFSGTVTGVGSDAIEAVTEGQASPVFNVTVQGCSFLPAPGYAFTQDINVTTGTGSYCVFRNNTITGCSYGIFGDTGYFDNRQITGNVFYGDGSAIYFNGGASTKNLLISNNVIHLSNNTNAFLFISNGSPLTGRITANTVIDDGTASEYVLNAEPLYTGTYGKLQVDSNIVSPTCLINGSGNWTGFGNMTTTGSNFTALNTSSGSVNAITSSVPGLSATVTTGTAVLSGTPTALASTSGSATATVSGTGVAFSGTSENFGFAAVSSTGCAFQVTPLGYPQFNALTVTGTSAASSNVSLPGSLSVAGSLNESGLTYLNNNAIVFSGASQYAYAMRYGAGAWAGLLLYGGMESTAGFYIGSMAATTDPGWTASGNTFAIQQEGGGAANLSLSGSAALNAAITWVPASTSGSASFVEPINGSAGKEIHIQMAAFNGTGSWTFPTAFTYTPGVIATSGTGSWPVASQVVCTTTNVVITTGSAVTGYIEAHGE